ncbi:hypothetical protein V1478_016465 [Vespula squamosa]|uniref:Uncharacterized protein n=1 Tax=Vespula squamosa TaxID=30214 RepID=A0ABD1ZZX4_VESSQ
MKTKEVGRGKEIEEQEEEQEEERKGAEGKAIFCSGSLKDPEILWFREAGSKETSTGKYIFSRTEIGDVGFSEKANASEVGTDTLNLEMSHLDSEIGSRDIRGGMQAGLELLPRVGLTGLTKTLPNISIYEPYYQTDRMYIDPLTYVSTAKYKLSSEHSDDLSSDCRLYQCYRLSDKFLSLIFFLLFKKDPDFTVQYMKKAPSTITRSKTGLAALTT